MGTQKEYTLQEQQEAPTVFIRKLVYNFTYQLFRDEPVQVAKVSKHV